MKKVVSFFVVLLADIFSLILAFYISYFLRVKIIPTIFNIINPWFFPVEHFYKMYYLLFVFIFIFSYEKLYTRRFEFFEEFIYITRGLFMSVILIAVIIYLSRTEEIFARTILILIMLIGMVIVPLVRYLVKKLLIVSGIYIKNAAVVGIAGETDRLLPTLKKLESMGYKIVDVLKPENIESIEKIERLTLLDKVETLIIIPKDIEKERLNRLISRCENDVKEIKIVSDSTYLKTIGVEAEYIEELLVMRMANNLLSPVNRLLKRGFDLVVSVTGVILMLPFFMVISLLIKIDSRGSILFIQERFGKEGKKFKFLKFRTMYEDADEKLKEYLRQNPRLQQEWDQYKKLKSFDPRVTRIGKFLRRFSLDESPQIFNVLKGDMSIVGPRPYLIREKEAIEQSAPIIFRVESGLTGLWQIKGRNELSFEARLKLDEFYVRNWSLFLDIVIILKTFGVVLKGKGAY
jgi:Undecaprenyl-phosphate galactose phosphotransferase WbaP